MSVACRRASNHCGGYRADAKSYKLASMFLPVASDLYINTRVTMVLFGTLHRLHSDGNRGLHHPRHTDDIACFAIIILVATFINGCLCLSNFDKGLLQAHSKLGPPCDHPNDITGRESKLTCAVDPANKTSLWSIPDQMSRSADEGASKYTTVTITGRGYHHPSAQGPVSPGAVGCREEGRLVID